MLRIQKMNSFKEDPSQKYLNFGRKWTSPNQGFKQNLVEHKDDLILLSAKVLKSSVEWGKKIIAESDSEVVHFLSIWVALPIAAYFFYDGVRSYDYDSLVVGFLMSKSDIFFPEQISFRFVKYAGQHIWCVCVFMFCVCMCVCNKHSLWVGWKTTWYVFILQHVQLIILKVFQRGRSGRCSKAIVQIQRRKYSFEKKVSYFFYIKVNLRRVVCIVYNHHQGKKALIQSRTTFLHFRLGERQRDERLFGSLSQAVFDGGLVVVRTGRGGGLYLSVCKNKTLRCSYEAKLQKKMVMVVVVIA